MYLNPRIHGAFRTDPVRKPLIYQRNSVKKLLKDRTSIQQLQI